MKFLRFLLIFLLLVILTLLLLLCWPKGTVKDQMAYYNVPAVAYGIIEDGKIAEINVIGELKKGVAAPQDALFNVASLTKPVFALAVLKLINAGELSLDEPMFPYWVDPDVEQDDRHQLLTARIMLSHQTGFPNWRWLNEDQKLAFDFTPGTKYQYSGEGYEYLRKAVQRITGLDWAELADSLLFKPLQMNDSRLIWDENIDEERFAKWHNADGEQYETFKRTYAIAADDLITTIADYCRFGIHVMKLGGLSKDLYREMISSQSAGSGSVEFGLGWELATGLSGNEYAIVHGGSDQGVRTRAVFLPESKRGFVIFTNGDNGQKILDRVMVQQFAPGAEVLSKIYAPVIWRVIYLPF